MSRYTLWLATVLVGISLTGCQPSQVADEDAQPADTTYEPADESANEPADEEAEQPNAPPESSMTPGTGSDPTTSAGGSSAPQRPAGPEVPETLTDGIEDDDVLVQYNRFRENAKQNPDDYIAQVNLALAIDAIGDLHTQDGRTEKGDEASLAAAAVLEASETLDKPQLPDRVLKSLDQMHAEMNVKKAVAHARKQETTEALTALTTAVNRGFSDLESLEQEEALADLRGTPEYAEELEKWKQIAAEWQAKAEAKAREEAEETLAAGETFPFSFSLTDVQGNPLNLADHLGKVVIVDIWGTWCPPCVAEIPSFKKLQENYADQGFQMIGLNYEHVPDEEKTQTVLDFIQEHELNYPTALLDEATQDQVPDLSGFPTTLFVDRSGKVRAKVIGLHDYEFLEAMVKVLLEEPATEGVAESEEPASDAPAEEFPATEEPATEEPAADAPADEPAGS